MRLSLPIESASADPETSSPKALPTPFKVRRVYCADRNSKDKSDGPFTSWAERWTCEGETKLYPLKRSLSSASGFYSIGGALGNECGWDVSSAAGKSEGYIAGMSLGYKGALPSGLLSSDTEEALDKTDQNHEGLPDAEGGRDFFNG